jgi:hypothetical protein
MRTVKLAVEETVLCAADLVDLLDNVHIGSDEVIEMPLRLMDGDDEYSPLAIYLDEALGNWEIVKDEAGQLCLVCVKV